MLANLALAALAVASAQSHELLVDLHTGLEPESSTPQLITAFNGGLLFAARGPEVCPDLSPAQCINLWLLGQLGADPLPLLQQDTSSNGPQLIFIEDLGNGRALVLAERQGATQLLATDGTVAGTAALPDLDPAGDDVEGRPIAWNGSGWFFGCTPDAAAPDGRICQLWRTDGTAAGTVLAHAFVGGIEEATLFTAGGLLYVSGRTGGSADWRLFRLSNAAGPPVAILDMPGLGGPLDPDTGGLEFQGELWFAGPDLASGTGRHLWRSDGTAAGTAVVLDGMASPVLEPELHAASATHLWFGSTTPSLGRELWVTDGSAGGTRLVEELVPGPTSGLVDLRGGVSASGDLFFNGRILGSPNPFAVFVHDGASPGPVLLSSDPGLTKITTSPAAFGSQNFFLGASSSGVEPWFSDGTPTGTTTFELLPGSGNGAVTVGLNSLPPAVAFGHAWFAGTDLVRGTELWRAQGSPASVVFEADMMAEVETIGSRPRNFARLGGELLFSAADGSVGRELFATDGTAAGTRLVADVNTLGPEHFSGGDSDPTGLVRAGDYVYFRAWQPGGPRLYRTDGTAAGTIEVLPAQSLGGEYFTALGDLLIRVSDTPGDGNTGAMSALDGSPGAVSLGTRIGLGSSEPESKFGAGEFDSAVLGDRLIFSADTSSVLNSLGFELSITDGVNSVQLVKDIWFGNMSSAPSDFETLGDAVVFAARRPDIGRELWITDGTEAGTTILKNLEPGPSGGNPRGMTRIGARVVFGAQTLSSGRALWSTDGTTAGTQRLVGLQGQLGSLEFVDVGSRLLVRDGFGLTDLGFFLTDGTPEGTAALDLPAGLQVKFTEDTQRLGGSNDILFRRGGSAGELVVYRAATDTWEKVPQLSPGVSTNVQHLAQIAGQLVYQADDPASDRELFRIPLRDLGAPGLDVFGEPCATPAGPRIGSAGAASLGDVFVVTVTQAPPASVANAFLGLGIDPLPLDAGCTSYPASPSLLATRLTDAAGAASVPIAIPDLAALVGVQLVAQWLVDDPVGPLFGLFSLSDALEVVPGP